MLGAQDTTIRQIILPISTNTIANCQLPIANYLMMYYFFDDSLVDCCGGFMMGCWLFLWVCGGRSVGGRCTG